MSFKWMFDELVPENSFEYSLSPVNKVRPQLKGEHNQANTYDLK